MTKDLRRNAEQKTPVDNDETFVDDKPLQSEILESTMAQAPSDSKIDDSRKPLPAHYLKARRNSGSSASEFDDPAKWPQIDGYIIEGHLGGGGFGEVFKAASVELGGSVAIKILKPRFSARAKTVQRFEQEVRTAAQNRSRHVVQVLARGLSKNEPFAGCHYLVTEYLPGGSFQDWIDDHRRNTRSFQVQAIKKIIAVCDALESVHSAGVIHRDLKPENILLDAVGDPKLADFGLATFIEESSNESSNRLTMTDEVFGTWAYMPPEQIRGARNCTPKSDQYAVGVMLYVLLCDLRPWQSSGHDTDERSRILSNMHSLPEAPSRKNHQVDRKLQKICLRCLEPQPQLRYSTIGDLRADLLRWVNNEPISSDKWLARAFHHCVAQPIVRNPIRVITAVVVLLALLIAGCAAGYQLAYVLPSQTHYQDVVERWGVLEGINPVSPNVVRQRPTSYRITSQGLWGKTIRVERINGYGKLVRNSERLFDESFSNSHSLVHLVGMESEMGGRNEEIHSEVRIEYQYRDNGELDRVIAFNPDGEQLWIKSYDAPNQAHYQILASRNRQIPTSRSLFNALASIGRDQKDRIADKALPAELGASNGDTDSENPSVGLLSHFRSGANDFLVNTGAGMLASTVAYDFDEQGNTVAAVFFDHQGVPRPNYGGVYGYVDQHDQTGRIVKRVLLGQDGKMSKHVSAASIEVEYEPQLIRKRQTDADGQVTNGVNSQATVEITLDELGRVVSSKALNADDAPVLDDNGIHEYQYAFDEQGNISEVTHLGVDGKAAIGIFGFTKATLQYTTDGKTASVDLSGDDATPPMLSYYPLGVYRLELTYQESGAWSATAFLKKDAHTHKIAQLEFDDSSRLVATEYFTPDGEPMLYDGYHRIELAYDSEGNAIRERYFGIDGKPVLGNIGAHGFNATFDDRGNRTALRYVGVDGRPAAQRNGTFGHDVVFDENNRVAEARYVDAKGKPATTQKGYYRATYKYDDAGNVIAKRYFGADNEPVVDETGVHGTDSKFDSRGYEIEKRYINITGDLATLEDGESIDRTTYDDQGNRIAEAYFNKNDEPFLTAQGLHRWTGEYDDAGNLVESRAFGPDGEPVLAWGGYHISRAKYDRRGNQIESSSFGLNDEPVIDAEGNHRGTQKYDDFGNPIEQHLFGIDNQPILSPLGFSSWKASYDAEGNEVTAAFFDVDGKPKNNVYGFQKRMVGPDGVLRFYDAENNELEERGVLIIDVTSGSQADLAGIEAGDILLSYDGSQPTKVAIETQINASAAKSEPVSLKFERKGKPINKTFAPGTLGIAYVTNVVSTK